MIVIDNFPFLKKNYKSQTTFAVKNLGLKLVSIKANDAGNVVEEQYEDGTKILLEYDLNNNIVSEIWNKNNEVLYCEKHQYDFNEKGFLEKSYFAQFNGKATNSNWQLIEEYDEDGNLISVKKDYEGDGNIDFRITECPGIRIRVHLQVELWFSDAQSFTDWRKVIV